jgi:hypothetical protein
MSLRWFVRFLFSKQKRGGVFLPAVLLAALAPVLLDDLAERSRREVKVALKW